MRRAVVFLCDTRAPIITQVVSKMAAAPWRHTRRDVLSRDIYEIRTKIEPLAATDESPWRSGLCNERRTPIQNRRSIYGRIVFQNYENFHAIDDVSTSDACLVLPLLRSANKFIVWHVNGCVRAKKLQLR